MRSLERVKLVTVFAVLFGSAACEEEATGLGPASLAIASGNGQTGRVGQALAQPLVVTVTGADQRPFAGGTVTWQVTSGAGAVSSASSATNASGQASTVLTLGSALGPVTVSASVSGIASVSFSATAIDQFVATLIGANEVPPVTTAASGRGTVTAEAGRITYTIDVANISNIIGAHIHAPGPPGVVADVIVPFYGGLSAGAVSGTFVSGVIPVANLPFSLDSLLALIRNGLTYVNVHTTARPGGEIRGPLVRN